MAKISEQLLNKAQEAFILAVEIYNKPTIKYRVEGFSFFICNAWELMLKAHLINTQSEDSIYYKDNLERTINLENCIKKIFTNDKDPLRLNLEKIIELRNTSTHFITEEYEMVYVPLFQACVFNFSEKIKQFHNIDISELISLNFLNLVIKEKSFDEYEIKAKYSDKIAKKLIGFNDRIANKITEENNDKFAITIKHEYYFTKDKNKATDIIAIDKSAKNKGQIIQKIKDPNETHKYTVNDILRLINRKIESEGIKLKFNDHYINSFNKFHFGLFIKYYNMKNNEKWCFVYKTFKNKQYTYSIQAIDFIFDEIKNDPENILNNIKKNLSKIKPTPGAKEF